MKEIRVTASTGYTGYERKVISSTFEFTDDERNDLFGLLKGFENKKVKNFIDHLETDLNMAYWVIRQPEPRDQRLRLQDLIKSLDNARESLFKILSHQHNLQILPPRQVDFLMEYMRNEKHPRPNTNAIIRDFALTIYPPLKEMIKTLESALQIEKTEPSRPIADRFGLASCITKRFEEYIKPLRPYSRPLRGVIKVCFKAVGMTISDRSRAITSVLKKPRKS